MTKQKSTGASVRKGRPKRPCSAERGRGESRNGSSRAKVPAKPQATTMRRACSAEQAQAKLTRRSRRSRQSIVVAPDRKLLQLARFPGAEPGVTLEYLARWTNRSEANLEQAVSGLVEHGVLEEVTLSGGSSGVALTEYGLKKGHLLPAEDVALVRFAAEEMAVQVSQLVRLSRRPEDEVRARVTSLVRRGFLERKFLLRGEGSAVWPSLDGLSESGFRRESYRTSPSLSRWPHTVCVVDTRIALMDEFAPVGAEAGWRWVSERMRSREFSRTRKHLPDGILVGPDRSIAVEVVLTVPHKARLRTTMAELAEEHTDVWYYCGPGLEKNAVERALRELKLSNVQLRDLPGPLVYEAKQVYF